MHQVIVYRRPSLPKHLLGIAIRRIAVYTTGDNRDTRKNCISRWMAAPGRDSGQHVRETQGLRNPYDSNIDEGRIGVYSRAASAGRTTGDIGSGLHHAWLLLPAVQLVAPSFSNRLPIPLPSTISRIILPQEILAANGKKAENTEDSEPNSRIVVCYGRDWEGGRWRIGSTYVTTGSTYEGVPD